MASTARLRVDDGALAAYLATPDGPVWQDMARRALRVQNEARRLAPVDTGRLRNSIVWEVVLDAGVPVARVGSNVEYALAVHEGTGLYGPRHQRITPVRARVLAWPVHGTRSAGNGRTSKTLRPVGMAFARSVRGMPARPFLRNALPAGLT